MPCVPKVALLTGTAVMAASAYLLGFAASSCFEPFDLSDDVDEVLCLSCERAAVKRLGWVALGMLGYGLLCMWGFGKWADAKVRSAGHMPRVPNPQISIPQLVGNGQI